MPDLIQARASIPDTLAIQTIELTVQPDDRRRFSPFPEETQRLGVQWLGDRSSPVLKAPSAISEAEWNFLLNPAHPDCQNLKLGVPRPFSMDPRIPYRQGGAYPSS
jgi:RES domain-containing protein